MTETPTTFMRRQPEQPPRRPYTLSEIPLTDALIALAVMALAGAVVGYTLGLGRAASIAERAEAVAVDAEATLAQARALCGGGR